MVAPTERQLTTKQKEILLLLLKLRAATIYNIVYYVYPELRGKGRSDKKFENGRKNISAILKRLQNAGYVEYTRPKRVVEVYYYLTSKGLYEVYDFLERTEFDINKHTGFDFDLGYIPVEKFTYPFETTHGRFQIDVLAYIESLKRLVSQDEEERWVFGNVKITNICSVRDNLHSSPRNTDLRESMIYKPDGEIRFVNTRYDDKGNILPGSIIHHYFLENDLATEYGKALQRKFERLKYRLDELDSKSNALKYYKGMIVVFPDSFGKNKITINSKRNIRYMNFVKNKLRMLANERFSDFNIIGTTLSDLDKTLLSLRTEYMQSFKDELLNALKFPLLQKTFEFNENLMIIYKDVGDIVAHITSDNKYFCLFFNIEGLNFNKWRKVLSVYTEFKNHPIVKKLNCTVLPIATFRRLFPYSPYQLDDSLYNSLQKEEKEFFEKLYLLDLRSGRPIIYKDFIPVEFHEVEFIVK